MPVGAHVSAIPIRQLSERMHVELHHLVLPVPVGVEKIRPVSEARVIDEMVDRNTL